MPTHRLLSLLAKVGFALLSLPVAIGHAEKIQQERVDREACADRHPLRRAYFGDLHVHTRFSLDASTMGTRTHPRDAYRFAQGKRLGIQPMDSQGNPMRSVQLARPLDFAAVTDHAELFGETQICNHPDLPGGKSIVCMVYRNWPRVAFFWMNAQASRAVRHDFCGKNGEHCLEAARTPWREMQEAAEAAYDRTSACRFTTFHAYEWTGAAGLGNNAHRNVIFASEIVPELPISFIDAPVLTDFWSRLDRECRNSGTGCDVLVIPHNSNLGAGLMFRTTLPDGSPIPRSEAQLRTEFEPLVEIMQHKGDSECLPGLGNTDELCAFEKLTMGSFGGRFVSSQAKAPVARQFVRNIYKEGLVEEARLGIDPFRFGIIASTDTHLGTPGLAEESADFPGHGGAGKPAGDELPAGLPDHLDFNPGGLAVVWAEENTRSSLFAAMQRKETYGTSGPRMQVRFFGGWDFPADLCQQADWVERADSSGQPMGSVLGPPAKSGELAPVFIASALGDPGAEGFSATPLQRIQIIKGWSEGSSTHERVYDIAGDPPGEAQVNVDTCETSGSGHAALCSVWRDPDFDPNERAFYYARVLENPSCRWSQKLCIANRIRCNDPDGVPEGFENCCSPEHRRSVQERAWTSPIWYSPSKP